MDRRWYLLSPTEEARWSRVSHRISDGLPATTRCGKLVVFAEWERAKGKPRCKLCLSSPPATKTKESPR